MNWKLNAIPEDRQIISKLGPTPNNSEDYVDRVSHTSEFEICEHFLKAELKEKWLFLR